jgi:hypothetical protein
MNFNQILKLSLLIISFDQTTFSHATLIFTRSGKGYVCVIRTQKTNRSRFWGTFVSLLVFLFVALRKIKHLQRRSAVPRKLLVPVHLTCRRSNSGIYFYLIETELRENLLYVLINEIHFTATLFKIEE